MPYLTDEQIQEIRNKANKKKHKLIPPELQKKRGRKPGQKNKPKVYLPADIPADLGEIA
jgi:hypothetical protein